MTATALAASVMKPRALPAPSAEVIYPDSDGKPMADNTRQFDYIVMIQGGLAALFADRADVFVAGDLLWYPVEGNLQKGWVSPPEIERQRAEAEQRRAERLAEQLRALGIDPGVGDECL